MALRSSLRHSASRSVSTSIGSTSASAQPCHTATASSDGFGSTFSRCSSKCSISSFSARLNVPMRLNISSQSTSEPSNSGPSMQTNLVFPPIVRRHAPHMPVPSTIIVFRETSVGMPYFCVRRQQNFIIMGGPMANALSTCSCSMSFSMPTVTTPFSPYEPSSVMTMVTSLCLRTSSSRIISSLVRPASTDSTRLPAAFSAFMMGSMGATPTPPPAQSTVPNFSMWVGLPSGPTTSVMKSPSPRLHNLIEESPTRCTTIVIVPLSASASAMVSGIRSPFCPTLTMTKLPALRLRAISGASISKRNTFSENCSLRMILFICLVLYG